MDCDMESCSEAERIQEGKDKCALIGEGPSTPPSSEYNLHLFSSPMSREFSLTPMPSELDMDLVSESDFPDSQEQQGLPPKRKTDEKEAIHCLQKTLKIKYPAIWLYLYGSSLEDPDQKRFIEVGALNVKSDFNILREVAELVCQDCELFENVRICDHLIILDYLPKNLNIILTFDENTMITIAEIMEYLSSLDARVAGLIMVVKLWAREHNLCNPDQPQGLDPHALAMMVVFFLQQRKILPPICDLHDSSFESKLFQWGFKIDRTYVHECMDTAPVSALLIAFFDYYNEFPFEYQVICTYLGYTVPRQMFRQVCTIPDKMEALKIRSIMGSSRGLNVNCRIAMCIQDPVAQDNNLCEKVNTDDLLAFMELIGISARLCAKSMRPEVWLNTLLGEALPATARSDVGIFAVAKISPYLGERVGETFTWLNRRMKVVLDVMESVANFRVVRVEYRSGVQYQKSVQMSDRTKLLCTRDHAPLFWLCEGNDDVLANRTQAANYVRNSVPILFSDLTSPLVKQRTVTRFMSSKKTIAAERGDKSELTFPTISVKMTIYTDHSNFAKPLIFLDVCNRHSSADTIGKWRDFFAIDLPRLVSNTILFENNMLGPHMDLTAFECRGCMFCFTPRDTTDTDSYCSSVSSVSSVRSDSPCSSNSSVGSVSSDSSAGS